MSKKCEKLKNGFLNAYACYDWRAKDSLAEVLRIIPVSDFSSYPETPDGAVIFAMTGTDGCHYCMVENDSGVSVYIVYPDMGYDKDAYLVGDSISDLLSYALAIQGLFECAFVLQENVFLQEVSKLKREMASELNSSRFTNDLNALKKEFVITTYSPTEVYRKLRTMNNT